MKIFYKFSIEDKVKNADGTTVDKTINLALAKPTTDLREKAEVFYAKVQSGLVAQGVLTRQMLQKRLLNDGGVLSETEVKETVELYQSYYDLQKELQKIITVQEKDRSDEQKQKYAEIIEELTKKQALINEFEQSQAALYDTTAESIARTRTVFWWVLNLALKSNDKGEFVSYFSGDTYDKKKESYDELFDNEAEYKTISYFRDLVSLWYVGRATNQEEFDTIIAAKKEAEAKQNLDKTKDEKREEVKEILNVVNE